jgi:murein DD-endopeptidase MepM/ murein hydrolase activator NlpD
MSGGFLVTVIAVVLAIVVATPQYAEPALAAEDPPAEAVASLEPETAGPALVVQAPPTSDPPDELRGYGWPVRGGGSVDTWFQPHPRGDFEVNGQRIHDGLVITWFEGAKVKAAHKGTVVAAGRDWARHVGFDGPVDKVYARYAKVQNGKKKAKSKKPLFSQGVVIDDGNGYYSVYTELKDLLVKPRDKVKPGQIIGHMSVAEGKYMMRYRLVRMDGPLMKVHDSARERGYPDYARERVDPLAVLDLKAKRKPKIKRRPPADPPRLSDY